MTVSELLAEIRQCMVLKGENPFKVRAFEKAEGILSGRTDIEERVREGTLTELDGIGKGISEVVTEFVRTGHSKALEELSAAIPPALRELIKVPGLGPKKAQVLIEELGLSTLGELEYACRENRLAGLKGFGEKAQAKILEGVLFLNATRGQMRWVEARAHADAAREALAEAGARVEEAGELRRRLEVVSGLDFLLELPSKGGSELREAAEKARARFAKKHEGALGVRLHFAAPGEFGSAWARATGSEGHFKALGAEASKLKAKTEEEFYGALKLPWIPPELRETGEEVALARAGGLAALLPWDGVRGVFHNHTTASDGNASLEEMVKEARRLGYKYIGISDHSQSAFYARGLKGDDLKVQERAVRALQDKYDDIRIFWGVESDILQDGELDYTEAQLKRFDFVIASIHSRFQMDRKAMTQRILNAIRNPHTTMIGHLTGRLLLGRKGFELDEEAVFAEAGKRQVVVEINAHPQRLDVDWRHGPLLREHRVPVSINPDAHDVAGLSDVPHGVAVARKALLPAAQVVNSRDLKGMESWLKDRKQA